jgi:hypothetical protein
MKYQSGDEASSLDGADVSAETFAPRDWEDPLYRRCDRGGRRNLRDLLRQMDNGELLVPDYQRGRVWTERQKAEWVGHVLSGAPCPAITLRLVNGPDVRFRDEIVDGQQRLTSCQDWLAGRVGAHLSWCDRTVWCDGDEAARVLYRVAMPVVSMPVETTDAEALRMYLAINTSGTPHTDAELDRVRGMLAAMGGEA